VDYLTLKMLTVLNFLLISVKKYIYMIVMLRVIWMLLTWYRLD